MCKFVRCRIALLWDVKHNYYGAVYVLSLVRVFGNDCVKRGSENNPFIGKFNMLQRKKKEILKNTKQRK